MRSDPTSETAQLKIRTNQPLRAALEKAAAERKISMNSEIIDRLEKSFSSSGADGRNIGPEITGLCMLLAQVAQQASTVAGTHATWTVEGVQQWYRNPYTYDQVVRAMNAVLEAFRPAEPVQMPNGPFPDLYKVVGEGLAATWLKELATGEAISGSHVEVLPALEEKLATMLDRIRGRDFGVDAGIKLPE